MKRIGTFLKSARMEAGITYRELARDTKIKPEFLENLEEEQWDKLPELPVVVGFVKSVADALAINRDQAVALLRRDYPPRKLSINPKPDLKREFRIGPRFIIGLVCTLFVCVLAAYLIYQYRAFTSPPALTVISPVENELVSTTKLTVRGTTDLGSTVRINGQPALSDKDGNFVAEIEVASEMTAIEIKAISRSGRETVISRTIDVELKNK